MLAVSVTLTVVIDGAPGWSAAGPGRVRRAPWVVWGHVGVVECAFSASLVQDLRLRKWSIHSVCQSVAGIRERLFPSSPARNKNVLQVPVCVKGIYLQ